MSIPDEALEAAGGAVYDALSHLGLNGTEADNVAEVALEAAFKIVAARIWDEGQDVGYDWACWADRTYDPQPDTTNPYSGVLRDHDAYKGFTK